MYTIKDVEDFKLFLPNQEACDFCEPLIAKAKKENHKFLEENEVAKPKMNISGSFVYAHPPNYRGWPMQNAGVQQWQELLQHLKAMGMDTVILQSAGWLELGECYYNSTYFNSLKSWNVIEPLLEATQLENMDIYIGGMGTVSGWSDATDKASVKQEIDLHINCFKELLKRYYPHFKGFYYAPETAFKGERDLAKEQFLNECYRKVLGFIKDCAPDIKIQMSPGTKYFEGKELDSLESWLAILKDVPLDILAPQDSIGTAGNQLRWLDRSFKTWKQVSDAFNIELWSNVEVFEREDKLEGLDYNYKASSQRIAAQRSLVEKYVSKMICWEAPYYLLEKV